MLKMKNGNQYKIQKKARMGKEIMSIKTLRARWKIILSSVTIHSVQFFKFRF